MYATIGLMGEKYGTPYNTFPFSCMEFGKSSIANCGGTCGALIGGAQVISLFFPRKIAIPLQAELLRWYEVTPLPIFKPKKGSVKVDGKITANPSDSILCHVSVSRWCNASGFGADSPERSERCGRLTADVAKKTAELIALQMDNKFKSRFAASKVQESCRVEGCHGGNDEKFAVANLKGTMECTPCHSGTIHTADKITNHP